ncbi:unnamed protein product [Strongylus vulgaris]|uniref:Malic enzyme n=1 Tax=Strongylus vulgaris TaxID=40348 RepID=A0A3P7J9N6_STRVU|nr:unnamed protein product [Strongylus vulgaris]
MSQEQQVYRILRRIRNEKDDLQKYIILDELQSRTEKLFYRVLCENVKELMPIVYTPTVGLACQRFGEVYRHPKFGRDTLIQFEDFAFANAFTLLDRYKDEYCTFNDDIQAVTKRFGRDTLIQFEDFAFANAFTLLDRYKDEYCTFNDDIQGTAAVAVAGLLATTRITKLKLSQQKIVFLGAGAATLGISELIVTQMMSEGLTREQAQARIFLLNSKGLITKEKAKNLTARAQQYAKATLGISELIVTQMMSEGLTREQAQARIFLLNSKGLITKEKAKNLTARAQQYAKVVKMVKPNALLGLSTVGGAFTPEILREMAKINPRPIIFALSNPTSKAECTAEDAYKYTNGQVLFASGSPFEDVEMNGKLFKPGQGNNSYIFPGVALGAVLFKAKRIPNETFLIAARRCAASVTEKSLNVYSRLYPRHKNIRDLSADIALDEMFIRSQIYSYEYSPVLSDLTDTYDWPETDTRQGFPVPKMTRTSMDDE